MKTIYIPQIGPRMHTSMKLMIKNPPRGYTFVQPNERLRSTFIKLAFSSSFIKWIYKSIIRKFFHSNTIYKVAYTPLIDDNCNIVYSSGQVLDIKKPWVIEILDHPACMAGYDFNLFKKSLEQIEKKLLSNSCRAIIVVNESSLRIMKRYFSKKLFKKIVLVRSAISFQKVKRDYSKENVNILFMGSIANPEDFFLKGGLEALETFKIVSLDNPRISLKVRCKVPDYIKEEYSSFKSVEFIDRSIKESELAMLWKGSDILLNPGHVYPLMTILEAMSYGLPIIMLDSWGVRDYLRPNRNAILVKLSDKIKGYTSEEYPLNARSKEFIQDIKALDPEVINRLALTLRKLITNNSLRKRLGTNAKKDAETLFSIKRKNNQLKEIFDKI